MIFSSFWTILNLTQNQHLARPPPEDRTGAAQYFFALPHGAVCHARSNYSGGDQLSGGPGENEGPHKGMFLAVMDSMAVFNARTLNRTNIKWEGHDLRPIMAGMDRPFFGAVWPLLTGQIVQGAPEIMEAAGVMLVSCLEHLLAASCFLHRSETVFDWQASDPAWDPIRYFVANQGAYYEASCSLKEEGGLYNHSFSHGDTRSSDNGCIARDLFGLGYCVSCNVGAYDSPQKLYRPSYSVSAHSVLFYALHPNLAVH